MCIIAQRITCKFHAKLKNLLKNIGRKINFWTNGLVFNILNSQNWLYTINKVHKFAYKFNFKYL